jgi:hypothetical protein
LVAADFITQLKTIINDSSVPDITMEELTDAVIDELNLQGLTLSNMAGSAGSKTITLTSNEKGAVRRIFRVIYASWYKNAAANNTASIGSVSISTGDLISQPQVIEMIERTAALLKKQKLNPPIYVANDPLPYE